MNKRDIKMFFLPKIRENLIRGNVTKNYKKKMEKFPKGVGVWKKSKFQFGNLKNQEGACLKFSKMS